MSQPALTLIRNATIVTMNDRFDVVDGTVVVRDGRIVSVGGHCAPPVRWPLEFGVSRGDRTGHLTVVRGALCVGDGSRAGGARRARREGDALPRVDLKLGSGIAPVVDMRARGISVSLGADGAACNNRLDMFEEIRLAIGLQAVRYAPGALTARDGLWMATREGARALGLEEEIGSIEPGSADLIVVERDRPHIAPDRDPYSTLAFAARCSDVRLTMVDGEVLVDRFAPVQLDGAAIAADARYAAAELAARAEV